MLAGVGLPLLASGMLTTGPVGAAGPTKQQAQQPPVAPFPGAITYRLYATREGLVGYTTANGHVIKERDRFVALPSRGALSKKNGYEKQVLVAYKGRYAVAPVWDVVSPAGIDLADGLFWDDLKMIGSDWVDVTFLWLSPGGAYFTQPLPANVRTPIAAFPATESKRFFAETGHSLANPFKGYWEANGGLAQFGYPLTEPFGEKSLDDGKTYTTQYFERARFEHHPEKAGTPYEVLLGFLGKAFKPPDPATKAATGARFFAETGHNLSGRFREYWEQRGGLPIYGFPITEVFEEVSPTNGKPYKVQYFERARFEHHPENAAPNDVLLGQLGRQLLDIRAAFPAQ
jgi:hypothetical protein